ncbi:hypothetical protein FGB62_432g03 [Gracilaria domingensis]|nr:hypothetical protein FGB62_432g03 [Gracilaria domingensis]
MRRGGRRDGAAEAGGRDSGVARDCVLSGGGGARSRDIRAPRGTARPRRAAGNQIVLTIVSHNLHTTQLGAIPRARRGVAAHPPHSLPRAVAKRRHELTDTTESRQAAALAAVNLPEVEHQAPLPAAVVNLPPVQQQAQPPVAAVKSDPAPAPAPEAVSWTISRDPSPQKVRVQRIALAQPPLQLLASKRRIELAPAIHTRSLLNSDPDARLVGGAAPNSSKKRRAKQSASTVGSCQDYG